MGVWHIYIYMDFCLGQGSPTFLKLVATSCVPNYANGYQFDTHCWNNKFAQFTFNQMLSLIINDIHPWEDADHVNDFSQYLPTMI